MSFFRTVDQAADPGAPSGGEVRWYSKGQAPFVQLASGLVVPLTGSGGVLTTDGDLLVRSGGVDARLPIGTEGQSLIVTGGAVVWGPAAVDPLAIRIDEDWHAEDTTTGVAGRYSWFRSVGPGGSTDHFAPLGPNAKGVIRLSASTGAGSYASVHNDIGAPYALDKTGADAVMELSFRMSLRNSAAAADLELIQFGFREAGSSVFTTAGEGTAQGLYIRIVGGAPGFVVAELVARDGVGTTTVASSTVLLVNAWHRLGFRYASTSPTGSAQLVVNGADQGAPITTNIPSVALALGHKIDSAGGTFSPQVAIDRTLMTQAYP